jgi:hypothetical protein
MEKAPIDTIRKVKALADNGVGGEKTAAQKKYKALLKKYKLTPADIEQGTTQTYTLELTDSNQIRIANQIIYAVTGIVEPIRANGITVTTTPETWAKIQGMFWFYWRDYKNLLESVFLSFATVHGLFPQQQAQQQGNNINIQPGWLDDIPQPAIDAPLTQLEAIDKQKVEQILLQVLRPKQYKTQIG